MSDPLIKTRALHLDLMGRSYSAKLPRKVTWIGQTTGGFVSSLDLLRFDPEVESARSAEFPRQLVAQKLRFIWRKITESVLILTTWLHYRNERPACSTFPKGPVPPGGRLRRRAGGGIDRWYFRTHSLSPPRRISPPEDRRASSAQVQAKLLPQENRKAGVEGDP